MKKSVIVLLSAAFLTTVGCRHSLEVKNSNRYCGITAADHRQQGLSIALVPNSHKQLYFLQALAPKLQVAGNYKTFIANDSNSSQTSDIQLLFKIDYDGSANPGNFFVCFPGCFIFTHVWLGYGYTVHWETTIQGIDTKTGKQLFREPIGMDLDFRYARCGTSWANNMLFIFPFPLVNGFVNMTYDDKATPMFLDKSLDTITDYTAVKLVEKINTAYSNRASL